MTTAALQFSQTQSINFSNERLFEAVSQRPLFQTVWSWITNQTMHLLALEEVVENVAVREGQYSGRMQVQLSQIQGCSVNGKQNEFDKEFRPLQQRSKARWLSIANARRLGKKLPPVQLIKCGDIYFVEDGHHRISVARAFGDTSIEAEVVVY